MKSKMGSRSSSKKVAMREPAHNEKGYSGSSKSHMSWDSPASKGASMGSGPMPGAGELPPKGPGTAARRITGTKEMPMGSAASSSTPRGMKIYNQE